MEGKMEDIEKRGLPRYLEMYLNYKVSDSETKAIDTELYKEIPNDLKEYVDHLVDSIEVSDVKKFDEYPITYKERVVEEIEENSEESESDDDDDGNDDVQSIH